MIGKGAKNTAILKAAGNGCCFRLTSHRCRLHAPYPPLLLLLCIGLRPAKPILQSATGSMGEGLLNPDMAGVAA
jgi:hypothetical protein